MISNFTLIHPTNVLYQTPAPEILCLLWHSSMEPVLNWAFIPNFRTLNIVGSFNLSQPGEGCRTLGYWDFGIPWYWDTGTLRQWDIGLMEHRDFVILEYWDTGALTLRGGVTIKNGKIWNKVPKGGGGWAVWPKPKFSFRISFFEEPQTKLPILQNMCNSWCIQT